MQRKILLPDQWINWSFDDDYLIDDAHNKYHINDIRSLFFQRQLQMSLLGDQYEITSLKQNLKNKIDKLDSQIVIQLVNNEKTLKEVKFNI